MTREPRIGDCSNANSAEAAMAGRSGAVSVVVPVYNSATIIPKLIDRLLAVLESSCAKFEVLLVNDGSQDESWMAIRELVRGDPRLSGISLVRNFGQHNATLAGIRMAEHEVIVTMDDDLQQQPEDIPSLLACLHQGYDVVYGTPRRDSHAWPRVFAARIVKKLIQGLMGIPTATDITSFRAFRRNLREGFKDYSGILVSIDALLSWSATRFASIPVDHLPRLEGGSNYTLGMLIRYTVNVVVGYGVLPMRLASLIGVLAAMLGFGSLVYVLVLYFARGASVPGFTFLASIISILAGAQLIAFGVLGEYVTRMHSRLMGRPCYVIQEQARNRCPNALEDASEDQ
ncbi:glycosyltransferase family 2 protein [Candidatus Bipolaricaulota bacterium]